MYRVTCLSDNDVCSSKGGGIRMQAPIKGPRDKKKLCLMYLQFIRSGVAPFNGPGPLQWTKKSIRDPDSLKGI